MLSIHQNKDLSIIEYNYTNRYLNIHKVRAREFTFFSAISYLIYSLKPRPYTWTQDESGGADGDHEGAHDQIRDGQAHDEHVGHLDIQNHVNMLDA